MANPWDNDPVVPKPAGNPWDSDPIVEERGLGKELARQAGLTVRGAAKGAMALPGLAADAIGGVANMGLAAAGADYRFPSTSQAIDNVLSSAGVAQPENAQERLVQDAVGAMSGTGASVAAGRGMANAAGPVIRGIGSVLSAGPGMQTAASVTSAGAGGIAREMGASGGVQAAATLAGAMAPQVATAAGSAAVRGILRGGEQGRQTVNRNIELFKNASGESPSAGQASESRFARGTESFLSRFPGSAGVIQKSAQQKADAMGRAVQETADNLAPGASAATAGESIEKGINGFKEGFKQVQTRLYDTLDQHIPQGTPVQVGNTEFKLKELNAGIEGAPNISEFFKNSKIKGIDRALQADLELSATGGQLPYEAVKKLRTLIGNEIADNSLLSDVPRSKWTALYGALSEDLGVAANQAGPDATKAWQWANQFTKGQLGRLEDLSTIVGKDSPEKIFNAAMAGSKEGNTIIKRVVDAIPKENRKELASAVLKRMGEATPGQQGAEGGAFSSETFLTNINRLSPEARNTLFGRLGLPETPNKLAQLAGMAANMREGSRVFANPSGTGQALGQAGAVAGIAGALGAGQYGAAAAGGAGVVGANQLAKQMVNPKFVRWLGQETVASPTIAPSEVNALSRLMQR